MDPLTPGGPNANVAALLLERAASHPERAAIVAWRRGRAERITFGELKQRVAALAAGLQARGIGPGDRLLIFIPMSIDLYVALLASLYAGAAAVFLDAWADRARLDAAVAAAQPRAFLGTPKAHLLRLLSPAVRAIPVQWVAGGSGFPLRRYEARLTGDPSPPAPLPPDAPALVTFTTGSTGPPKAAARSHGFLWQQHLALNGVLGLTEADVDLPALPIFVLNNLAAGVTTVLPDFDPRCPAEFDPAAVYRQIVAEGVSTAGASPAFFDRLARWCSARRRALPLRALFTGGAPVLPPLARLLVETVAGSVHVLYGSTEAEPIAAIDARELLAAMEAPPNERPEGLCVGRLVPGLSLRLVRPTDGPVELGEAGWPAWEVGPGHVGEVVVAGPHVLAGYLEDAASDGRSRIRDGEQLWLRTGDAASLDAIGRLWLVGRLSARVQRAGRTWWSLPAELRAMESPGITHAAYLGLPDMQRGERAILCVETAGGRLSPEAENRLREALSPIPVDELHPFRRLPRDPRHASRTDTAALREQLQRSRGR